MGEIDLRKSLGFGLESGQDVVERCAQDYQERVSAKCGGPAEAKSAVLTKEAQSAPWMELRGEQRRHVQKW